ncbi:MAG: hypothetical protein WCA63_01320 [Gallionella sp.]
MKKYTDFAHIHQRKEIENYVLDPSVIDRTLARKIAEYNRRTDNNVTFSEKSEDILMQLTDSLKTKVSGQFLSKRAKYEQIKHSNLDSATINQRLLEDFDNIWGSLSSRLKIVPGKDILPQLNNYLQEKCSVTLSLGVTIAEMTLDEVSQEIRILIEQLDSFRTQDM